MKIERTKLEEYQAELSHAMSQLKSNLAESQTIIGIVESFMHLMVKEMKKNNVIPISVNGEEN